MTTETAVQTADDNAQMIERVVMMGDLSRLTAEQRVDYYLAVCDRAGLSPLTQPFQYLTLNGKLVLYPAKNATDQIRANRGISVTMLEREQGEETYDVTAYLKDERTGRIDAALGSVSIKGLRGEALANAKMKAETKAKRRGTLSMTGLSFLDEVEVASIPGAVPMNVNVETGEIIGQTEVKTLRERAEEAAAAAEGPQEGVTIDEAASLKHGEARGDDDRTEVDADTIPLFDEAPVASEGPEDLTDVELRKMCRHALIPMGTVATTAKRLFPDAKRTDELTDAQRGALWIVLMTEKDQ